MNQSFVRFLHRLKHDNKSGAFFDEFGKFIRLLKVINAREFTLDNLMVDERCYKLPFDELFSRAELSSAKKCFYCKRWDQNLIVNIFSNSIAHNHNF